MRKRQSHVAPFAARVNAIYSASVNNKANVACFFEHQLTGLLLSMRIKLEVDFQLFLSPVQLESKHPSTSSLSWPSKVIPYSLKPLRYCRTIFAASVCWWPRFFINGIVTKVANVMSGLVSTIENMMEPVMP